MAKTQISAYISEKTKQQVERYVQAHGVQKGHLVEEALLHHLQALRELPADMVIPPRITVTSKSFEKVARLVEKPRKPTQALRDLMAGKPVDGEPLDRAVSREASPENPDANCIRETPTRRA